MSKEDYILSYWGGRTSAYGFWTGHSPTRNKRWTQDSMRLTHLPARGFLGKPGAGPRGMGHLGVGARARRRLGFGQGLLHPSIYPEGCTPTSFSKVMTIPTIREPSLLFHQQGCHYSSEQSARESQCTGCPHLSACGQSPGKAVQGAKAQSTCLKKRTTELGGSFSRTLCP